MRLGVLALACLAVAPLARGDGPQNVRAELRARVAGADSVPELRRRVYRLARVEKRAQALPLSLEDVVAQEAGRQGVLCQGASWWLCAYLEATGRAFREVGLFAADGRSHSVVEVCVGDGRWEVHDPTYNLRFRESVAELRARALRGERILPLADSDGFRADLRSASPGDWTAYLTGEVRYRVRSVLE